MGSHQRLVFKTEWDEIISVAHLHLRLEYSTMGKTVTAFLTCDTGPGLRHCAAWSVIDLLLSFLQSVGCHSHRLPPRLPFLRPCLTSLASHPGLVKHMGHLSKFLWNCNWLNPFLRHSLPCKSMKDHAPPWYFIESFSAVCFFWAPTWFVFLFLVLVFSSSPFYLFFMQLHLEVSDSSSTPRPIYHSRKMSPTQGGLFNFRWLQKKRRNSKFYFLGVLSWDFSMGGGWEGRIIHNSHPTNFSQLYAKSGSQQQCSGTT